MRCILFVAAVATLALPTSVRAADPPVVFQTQPVGRVLTDARATVKLVAGDNAIKSFNDFLQKKFGEKGLDGLDLSRPIVGYALIPENLLDTTLVVALPVTGEKDFLELCERANGSKPKALPGGGVYELPSLHPTVKAAVRVTNQYAYIATGRDPVGALAVANLVPAQKLFDPTEQSLATAKLYFDRLPPGMADKALAMLEELAKQAFENAPGEVRETAKKTMENYQGLAKRYATLSKDAKLATLRLKLDARTGEVATEATLTANPGSALDKIIASKKPNTNKFASLVTPDTVVGFKACFPLFNEELRNAQVSGFEELRKQIPGMSPVAGAALDELFKGLVRTAKAGDFDFAGVVRGPDKKGTFTAIGAVAFEDAIPLEKAFRKFVDAEAPPDFKKNVKWEAAKAGTVNIHTITIPEDDFIFNELKKPFGDSPKLAFAFGPKGIYIAVGPDSIKAIQDALSAKPMPSPVVDVVMNPSRLGKLIGAFEPQAQANFENAFGKDDKLMSLVSFDVEGGKELKLTLKVNVKIIGQLGATAMGTVGEPAGK